MGRKLKVETVSSPLVRRLLRVRLQPKPVELIYYTLSVCRGEIARVRFVSSLVALGAGVTGFLTGLFLAYGYNGSIFRIEQVLRALYIARFMN